MVGIESVANSFGEFMRELDEGPRAAQLARLQNGFEGWLKVEFLLWLTRPDRAGLVLNDDVGVEYKFTMETEVGTDLRRKQCDLWIRSSNLARYHYVELKAPFANSNRGKVIDSAAFDLRCLMQMHSKHEQAASGAAVIVGSRFSEPDWAYLLARLASGAGIDLAQLQVSPAGVSQCGLRWVVWTHHFL